VAKQAGDLRRGNAIRLNGEIVILVKFDHVQPGKGPAYLQGKLRSIKTGNMREHRFRITEEVETVFTERKLATYSYDAGTAIVFMDAETFEEYQLQKDVVGDEIQFIAEGESLELEIADGEIYGVAYPDYVERTVSQTIEGVKKAAVTNQVKPATLDTGIEVGVPIFIKEGEVIRIDPKTGKYHERAK